jgi:transposase
MFIRKKIGKYKDKSYANYQLVESVRTPKGPRQKVVCSLGNLGPRSREEWLVLVHKLESALVGQMDLFGEFSPEVKETVAKVRTRQKLSRVGSAARRPKAQADDIVAVLIDAVENEFDREAGPVHVGYQYWRKLGFPEILADVGLSPRESMLTCVMTMNRLVFPCSEHAMPNWIRSTALADILGEDFESLTEDPLYRNLDTLYPKRAQIESRLADRERTLFNLDQTVLLYDLTSTYFEGLSEGNWKAKKGYSRDKRPDCNQVVVGLVVNRDGFPLAHEVFDGNTQDQQTVGRMLDLLDARIPLKPGQTVVVDRGMAYEKNIQEIKARRLHYLVASRQPERDQWLSEFEDLSEFAEVLRANSPNNRYQKKSCVRVRMKKTKDETHVLCLSEGRKEKDRAIREKQERRLLTDLEKLKTRVSHGRLVKPEKIGEAIGRIKERYPRVARYYSIAYDASSKTFSAELIRKKLDTAMALDGSYLLKTDRTDLNAEEAWKIHNLLTRAEDAFRTMKSPLGERPIHHQLPHRVDTHIFLCVLAYHLLIAIEKTLKDKGEHTSFATVRQTLRTHRVSTIVLPTDDGRVLKIRKASKPEQQVRQLYQLLEVPEQVMRPRKTWIDNPDDL